MSEARDKVPRTILFQIDEDAPQDLLQFENVAHDNVLKVLTMEPRLRGLLETISKAFFDLQRHFRHCPLDEGTPTPLYFLPRSHSAFLAAARMACSCQYQETFMLLRGSLECAMYAYYVMVKPELARVWWQRDRSDDHRKSARDAFRVASIWKAFSDMDSVLRDKAKATYESSIDQGAHPNVGGTLAVTDSVPGLDRTDFSYSYLEGLTPHVQLLHFSLLNTGNIALELFKRVFPEACAQTRVDKLLVTLCANIAGYYTETKPSIERALASLHRNVHSAYED